MNLHNTKQDSLNLTRVNLRQRNESNATCCWQTKATMPPWSSAKRLVPYEGTQVTSTVSTVPRWARFPAVRKGVIILYVRRNFVSSSCIYFCNIPDLIFVKYVSHPSGKCYHLINTNLKRYVCNYFSGDRTTEGISSVVYRLKTGVCSAITFLV